MTRRLVDLLPLLVTSLFLAACATTPAPPPTTTAVATLTSAPATPTPEATSTPQGIASGDLTRTDEQGAVTVEVKPLNLNSPGQTIDFEVSMNTHSVNLGMD